MKKKHPGCGKTIQRIDAILHETGGGLDTAELQRRVGVSIDHICNAMTIGVAGGLFEFHVAPVGRAWNRRVYYTAGTKPEKAPPPRATVKAAKASLEANGTRGFLDPRFDVVGPVPRMVNPAECRPWANVAAQQRREAA